MNLLEAAKLNDDDAPIEEQTQPNRGNKTSKKNKRKNKNQDWEEESAGIIYLI